MNRVMRVNWLELAKVREWSYPVWSGFHYDEEVTDAQIQAALTDPRVENVNPNLDWEDDCYLTEETSILDSDKHAYRTAAIIRSLLAGNKLKTIEVDTYCQNCCSCIPDGHHRIRALEFLHIPIAPFALSGGLEELRDLVSISGVPAKQAKRQYTRLIKAAGSCDHRVV